MHECQTLRAFVLRGKYVFSNRESLLKSLDFLQDADTLIVMTLFQVGRFVCRFGRHHFVKSYLICIATPAQQNLTVYTALLSL